MCQPQAGQTGQPQYTNPLAGYKAQSVQPTGQANSMGGYGMPFDGNPQPFSYTPQQTPLRFDGSTQDVGNGMSMRQMGPTQVRPQPQGPTVTDPSMPRPQPQAPRDMISTLKPGIQGRPNPAQFPGVPQHILNAITTDPSGRMLYGPDKSPVKFEGGQMVFDNTPFVPGAGQFGQFGAPGAGGFRLDQSSGKNMILGGANGPQMYNAEGLVQDSQAPQNFVNYLNSYRR